MDIVVLTVFIVTIFGKVCSLEGLSAGSMQDRRCKMGRLTIEQAIEYWKIFLDEIEELKATPGTDPEEWDEQEKATVAALEALVKQRHYKDLEEHGRLIELPCAVGDTVYFITKNSEGEYIIGSGRFSCSWLDYPRTIYTTKEEAEAKLEELKGE